MTEHGAVFELMAAAYQACSAALDKLGEPEAAWIAADRAMAAAERAGNPLLVAAGAFRLVFVFMSARHYAQAEETAAHRRRRAVAPGRQRQPRGHVAVGRADPAARHHRRPDRRRRRRLRPSAAGQRHGGTGSARAGTTTTPSSAPPTSRCSRSPSRRTRRRRAGAAYGRPRSTPRRCRPSGRPGCSSTSPARMPSAARSPRRCRRWPRPRTSPPSRSRGHYLARQIVSDLLTMQDPPGPDLRALSVRLGAARVRD